MKTKRIIASATALMLALSMAAMSAAAAADDSGFTDETSSAESAEESAASEGGDTASEGSDTASEGSDTASSEESTDTSSADDTSSEADASSADDASSAEDTSSEDTSSEDTSSQDTGTVQNPDSTYPIKIVTYEDLESYVKTLLYEGVEIVPGSVKLTCSDPQQQLVAFQGASSVTGYDAGLAITNGSAVKAFDSTITGYTGTGYSNTDDLVDPDLQALFPDKKLNDSATLEFTIVANGENLNFNYNVFSREWDQNAAYQDAFGLFVNGENIAYLPNGETVNIDSIRNYKDENGNPSLYVTKSQNPDMGNFTGVSKTLKCSKQVKKGDEVTIKIAIADTTDHALDTLISIQGQSIAFIPEAINGTYGTNGIISEIPYPDAVPDSDINKAAFDVYPLGGYVEISLDGVNWFKTINVTTPGHNVPLSFYLRTANGVVTQKKTVYYNLEYPQTISSDPVAKTGASSTPLQAVAGIAALLAGAAIVVKKRK